MSDTSQGPGWWQASDGKWYPPAATPGAAPAAAPGAPPAGPPGAPPAGYAPAVPYVDWGTRVVASLLDGVFLLPLVVVAFILGLVSTALLFLFYIVVIAAGFYFSYLTGETGQSPGKRVMGIKVISEQTGQPIGGGNGIARAFIHIVDSICYIGYLSPLWDAKKQTFTDKIQNTIVVPGDKQPISVEIFKK